MNFITVAGLAGSGFQTFHPSADKIWSGKFSPSECSRLLSALQPDACQTDFDAVSMIRGELFFFKSGYVWRIRDGHLESGYPALASRHWRGIPSNIDAAFEDKSGNIWFFQGEQDGLAWLLCRLGFLGKCHALLGEFKLVWRIMKLQL